MANEERSPGGRRRRSQQRTRPHPAEGGRVTGVECIRMALDNPTAASMRPCRWRLNLFWRGYGRAGNGAGGRLFLYFPESGIELSRQGTIVADPKTMATGAPGIFAGGDAVLGARTVIEAIASANKAAQAIDAYLRTGKAALPPEREMEQFLEQAGVYNPAVLPVLVGGRERQEEESLPVAARLRGFNEAELGFKGPPEALREADRCACCLRLGLAVF